MTATTETTATGATPGTGATPAQAASEGAAAGATPAAAAGTNPAATDPSKDESALGEAGQRALAEVRRQAKDAEARAKAAEQQLEQLREASQSDAEKALSQARREAAAQERAKWQSRIREAEVRGALRGAGIVNEKLLALAVAAPEFRDLKVPEEGPVEGLAEAVAAFKKDYPEAFGTTTTSTRQGGAWGGGEGGSARKEPASLDEAVTEQLVKHR